MSFLKNGLSLLTVALLALAPLLVIATHTQNQTIGIDSSAVLYSSGWSTVSSAAGSFREASGKADEIQISLPAGTIALSYVGFKQTGGALYAICLDCSTSGQRLLQINASDPNADSSTPVVLFSFTGLDPTTSHILQVVNSADPAFRNTSELTFKQLDVTIDTAATKSSSSSTRSNTSTLSSSGSSVSTTSSTSPNTSSSATSSSSSDVSTSNTSLSQSTSTSSTTQTDPSNSASATGSTSSVSSSSTTTSSAGSLSRSGLSTGTIVAAAVSSAAAVLLLLALAIFLLYRARNRQMRGDSESVASGVGLTRQISGPSDVSIPFAAATSAAVSAYAPPRSATTAAFSRPSAANSVRRRSYMTGPVWIAAGASAVQRDGDASSTSSVPARPRNPYDGVVRSDVPIDYPAHSGNMPTSPRTPGTGRQRGMFR